MVWERSSASSVAAWLTRSQYGLWGILIATLIGLTWIKQVGIADKYIQQSEPDQELAFQKAFTLELCFSLIFLVLVAVALPIYSILYGRTQLIVPGLVLAATVPLSAFEAAAWIPYRRLQYGRQRFLNSVDPVTTAVLAITLTVLGLGYWGLVLGAVGGTLMGGTVCTITSPYRLKLRINWKTVKEYASFGWPLVVLGLSGMLTVQAILLAANSLCGSGRNRGDRTRRESHRHVRWSRRDRESDHLPRGLRGRGTSGSACRGICEIEPRGADVGDADHGRVGPVCWRSGALHPGPTLGPRYSTLHLHRPQLRSGPGCLQLVDLPPSSELDPTNGR